MLKISIIAGEPSGDMLASGLIHALKFHSTAPIEFMGIGGESMAKEGFISLFEMKKLSFMGIFEVIANLPQILRIRHQIIKHILEFKPDIFIGVDLPDFNLYVEKVLKTNGIKTVHYVSPTIWAWRYERIYKIKDSTDLMLCIFPLEEAIYKSENIAAKFIGHPLADNIEVDINTQFYKQKLNLKDNVFTVLVGSRSREIKNLAPIFIDTCNLIALKIPQATFIFPLVNQSTYDLFNTIIKSSKVKFHYKVLLDQTRDAIKASDLVLAKSGTVTLEVALCKKPLIISYKMAQLTYLIIKNKIKTKYVGQPNILLNEAVVPELLQNDANAPNLAQYFINLYNNKIQQQYMINKFYELHKILRQDANNKAAIAVLDKLVGIENVK